MDLETRKKLSSHQIRLKPVYSATGISCMRGSRTFCQRGSQTDWTQTRGIVRNSHTTITRLQKDKQSKTTSSLFPIEIIAKLQWIQSNAHQNREQLQNRTMGVTINNE